MLGKLLPCGGGASIPLLKESLLIGRKPDCDIPIACSSVSGHHCLLVFKDGAWWIRDLDSKNGTAINGQRVSKQRIARLDVLTFGRQRMVLEYQANGPAVAKRIATGSTTTKSADRSSDDDIAMAFLNSSSAGEVPAMTRPPEVLKTRSPEVIASVAPPTAETVEPKPRPVLVSDLGRLIPAGGGIPIVLTSTELILGRGRDCDVRIRYPSVSSRHCKLMMKEGYWHVEDLNSTNGTWVNGDRCLFECLLSDSILALDKHRFTIRYVPRSDGPPPAVRKLFTQSLLEKAGLAKEFGGDGLGGEVLPEDDLDRPKRYNLMDPDDE